MNKLPYIEKAKHTKSFGSYGRDDKIPLLFVMIGIIVIIFFTIGARLFHLSVVKGDYYRRLSDENRIREVVIEPKRGTLLDRRGRTLASNVQADVHAASSRLLSKRVYAGGEYTGPLIGYRQLASEQDIRDNSCLNKLSLGDKTGKKGIEAIYDCELRGVNGKKLLEFDAQGRAIKTLGVAPPIPGKTLTLALDVDLQKRAYLSIATSSATPKIAAVATRPATGEVLALVSSPTYDPQAFEDNNSSKIKEYLTSRDHPLFNRATEGTYPPGSVYKLVVAAGALEDKKIDEKTIIVDTGVIQAGPITFGNWYFLEFGKKEGEVDILKALKRSNDIFFYKTGEKLGPIGIKKWSERFGLGKEIRMSLDQSTGTLPSPFWKEEILKETWYLGDTYNLSIGQGYLLTTPLQIHQMATAFATGGAICEPKLLKDESPTCTKLKLSTKTMELVREGMRQACDTGGTGWPLFDFTVKGQKIAVGCKTGTAEAHGVDKPKPHAWFTVFAPFDNPQIQVTVLVENGGQGSDVAAPIARDLLTTYFETGY